MCDSEQSECYYHQEQLIKKIADMTRVASSRLVPELTNLSEYFLTMYIPHHRAHHEEPFNNEEETTGKEGFSANHDVQAQHVMKP